MSAVSPAASALEQVVPDGEEGLGNCCSFSQRKSGRNRQRVALVRQPAFGVAAADDQSHHQVANVPARYVRAPLNDFTGYLEAGNFCRAGRRRVKPHALHDIRPVDAGGGDFDQDLAGTRLRQRSSLGR